MSWSADPISEVQILFEPSLENEARDRVADAIDQYNMAATALPEWFPVNFMLRDGNGEIAGAALGYVWGGWLQITQLWVDESLRGQGYGSRLLAEAEAYGRSRGATGAALETHSFQARPFYERYGYRLFGTLEDNPIGHSKFFLRKDLT